MKDNQCNAKQQMVICEGDDDSASYIKQRLREYNMQRVPLEGMLTLEPLYVVLKDSAGNIVGGINANTISYWGKCHVDIFWIDEKYRGTGYGSKLLRRVEEITMERGCTLIQLDTYSFQAPEFYIKNGYEVFGTIEDCPAGHSQYFLKKALQNNV